MLNYSKKLKLLLTLILFLICLGFTYIYSQYNRYLPTLDTPSSQMLTPLNIDNIRQNTPITQVIVYKAERRLEILHREQIIKRYSMRLGFDPIGHKVTEGDGKTPEGHYVIDWRNPNSQFYKSLHISYPNTQDTAKAKALGVSAGGDIMIHGSANKRQIQVLTKMMEYMPRNDWTWGCIAVKNVDMDEIWKLVDNGTPITIFP